MKKLFLEFILVVYKNLTKLIILSFIVFTVSCSERIPETLMPTRQSLSVGTVKIDSLNLRRFPNFQVNSKHLILHSMEEENFLLIFDRKSGQKVFSVGKIGWGPGYWRSPMLGNVVEDKIVIWDVAKKQYTLIEPSNMYSDISNQDSVRIVDMMFDGIIHVDNQRYLKINFDGETPFTMVSQKDYLPTGKFPLIEKNLPPSFDIFRGTVAMHPQKNIVVYATIQNPYIAKYRVENNKLILLWETQFMAPNYTFDGKEFNWINNNPYFATSLAFTKDYIVCLVKDFNSKPLTGDIRNMPEVAPKSVYLFDYDGNIKHILDLPYNTVRIAADGLTNSFYAISLNPDYFIVEFDLSFDSL